MRKYLLIPLLIIALLVLGVMSFPKFSKALTTGVSLTATILTYITTAVDAATVAFGSITPDLPDYATSTVTTTTNNQPGYNVKVNRDDSDTTMDYTANNIYNITDQTAWAPGANKSTAGNATTTALLANSGRVLAFRVSDAISSSCGFSSTWWGSTTTKLWAGFASSAQTIFDCDTFIQGASTDSGQELRLNVGNTQKTGTYDGGITYTVTANP